MQVSGDLVHGDKNVLSGTFPGTVIVGSTIIQHATGGSPAAEPTSPRIFLSYGWNDDKEFVERLQADLKKAGFDVWRDETDLQSRGPDLSQELIREIDGRERFVPVIGPAAFASAAVQSEWKHAMLKCKVFTPIWRLGDREPPTEFKAKLYADFREGKPGYAYEKKLADLVRLLGEKALVPGPFLSRFLELPPGVIPRKELEPLRKLLDPLAVDGATIAITGLSATRTVMAPGGLGKSVLAAIFARECQTRWAFADGLVWLPVGKTPLITALQAELGALFGDKPEEYANERAGASRLQRLLHDREVLIVLDDVWNYHHAEPLVVDAPGCRWLITTRIARVANGLGLPRERVVALNYLDDEEGLALIARRVETSAEQLKDRENCLAIVHELGGHTQAIAIAAAMLKPVGAFMPQRLLERYKELEAKGNPLDELVLDENEREKNLTLSFKASYDELEESDRRRLRTLGVFSEEGTFGVEVVMAVWGDDLRTAEDALTRLVDNSLLSRASDERFAQHALLRAYALALLKVNGEEDETRERHFAYYREEYGDWDRNQPEIAGRHAKITTDFDEICHALNIALARHPNKRVTCSIHLT